MPGIRSGWRTIPTRYIVRKKQAFKVEPIPVVHDQFRRCYECGLIVPVYELQKKASIKDVVETTDNPFESGSIILGIDSKTLINGRKKQKKKERQKQLDDIKDEDLKRRGRS